MTLKLLNIDNRSPRQIAISNGEKYYNGNKCARNHNGKRLAKDGQCVECRSLNRKRERLNPNKRKRERDWELRKNFGITIKEYEQMLITQNFVCKICNQPEAATTIKGNIRKLAVDHCHSTGRVRGLLCYACNIAIGLLKHDVNILNSAALYCEELK